MIRINYLSQATPNFSSIDLLYLLEQCQTNNRKLGLTGLLIFGNGTFLQVIEGEDHIVDALMEKISKDRRHTNFQILATFPIDERHYSDWSMGFEKLTEQTIAEVPNLKNFTLSDFNPEYLSSNESVIESLLERHRSSHWDPLVREINARDALIIELRNTLALKQQQVESSMLLVESIIEVVTDGFLEEDHMRLCKSMLGSLRTQAGR